MPASQQRTSGPVAGKKGQCVAVAKRPPGWQTSLLCDGAPSVSEGAPSREGATVTLIDAVNARMHSAVNVSIGPLRSAVSRTSTGLGRGDLYASPPYGAGVTALPTVLSIGAPSAISSQGTRPPERLFLSVSKRVSSPAMMSASSNTWPRPRSTRPARVGDANRRAGSGRDGRQHWNGGR